MPSYDNAIKHMLSEADNRGVMRFNLPCKMLIPFSYFSNFQITNEHQGYFQFIIFVCMLVLNWKSFSISCYSALFLSVMYDIKIIEFITKSKISCNILCVRCINLQHTITRNIVNNMLEITSTQAEYGENDIRVISATYFLQN